MLHDKKVKELEDKNRKLNKLLRDSTQLTRALRPTVTKQQKNLQVNTRSLLIGFYFHFLSHFCLLRQDRDSKISSLEKKSSSLTSTITVERDAIAKERLAVVRDKEVLQGERMNVTSEQDSLRIEKLVLERKIALAVEERTSHLNDARERSSAALITALNQTSSQSTKIDELEENLKTAQTGEAAIGSIRRILSSTSEFEDSKYELFKLANDIVTKEVNGKTNIAELSWPKDNTPDKYHIVW